jgi:hypothetical protein
MTRAACLYAHAVRAELSQGWFEQPCADVAEATALFDRLTRYEGVTLERVENGRVVEIRHGALVPALYQLAVRTPLAA